MEVKTCKRCGKLFQYVSGAPVCMHCRKREEELFQEVKAYLREHKGASMKEVTEATGASTAMIEHYLKEGRLEIATESSISLNCEKCGAKVRTGRLCEKCRTNLSNSLNAAAKSIQDSHQVRREKVTEKMRFLNSFSNK